MLEFSLGQTNQSAFFYRVPRICNNNKGHKQIIFGQNDLYWPTIGLGVIKQSSNKSTGAEQNLFANASFRIKHHPVPAGSYPNSEGIKCSRNRGRFNLMQMHS